LSAIPANCVSPACRTGSRDDDPATHPDMVTQVNVGLPRSQGLIAHLGFGKWRLASKALRPLPTLHKELSEETRVRRRYADLVVREESRQMVRTRAVITRAVRRAIDEWRVGSGRRALEAIRHSAAMMDNSPRRETTTRPRTQTWSPRSTSDFHAAKDSSPRPPMRSPSADVSSLSAIPANCVSPACRTGLPRLPTAPVSSVYF
jgi:hypothetical protein